MSGFCLRLIALLLCGAFIVGCRSTTTPPPQKPTSRAPKREIPPLYATLFEEGRTWSYTYTRSAEWMPSENADPTPAPDTESCPVRCRVMKVRQLVKPAGAWLSVVQCELTRKMPVLDEGWEAAGYVDEGKKKAPFITEPAGLGSATYLASAQGLWVAKVDCDAKCLNERLAKPPLLAAAPRPREKGDRARGEPLQIEVMKRVLKVGKAKVTAWCRQVVEDASVHWAELQLSCFAGGYGLVLQRREMNFGARHPKYSSVDRSITLDLPSPRKLQPTPSRAKQPSSMPACPACGLHEKSDPIRRAVCRLCDASADRKKRGGAVEEVMRIGPRAISALRSALREQRKQGKASTAHHQVLEKTLHDLERIKKNILKNAPKPMFAVNASFEGKALYLGFDLAGAPKGVIDPRKRITIVHYWKVLKPLDGWKLRFYLASPNESSYHNAAHSPVFGTYPVTMWRPGEIIRDEYHFNMDKCWGEPRVKIYVGLYNGSKRLRPSTPTDGKSRVMAGSFAVKWLPDCDD